jgi:hypothetical protein
MREYDIKLSFRRCIFIGNEAKYGSNVFIEYTSISQRIGRSSFAGCTVIASNSY